MRELLREELQKLNVKGNWEYITEGRGLYILLDVTPE